MSLFGGCSGIGIVCDRCRRHVSGRYRSYAELLASSPGWTPSHCPTCASRRRARERARFRAMASASR